MAHSFSPHTGTNRTSLLSLLLRSPTRGFVLLIKIKNALGKQLFALGFIQPIAVPGPTEKQHSYRVNSGWVNTLLRQELEK